ncbi:hypothetical protein BN1221_02243c [Brenneria goodwinii]|uniref:Uncharacterized protein n=1 Tax=Brenneria goodwinii TaxID=1109412 RepID=A0A0G4JV97_9GAMM|nr:hypothetical protein BN1221_02243c [Brenneria goodwinii]
MMPWQSRKLGNASTEVEALYKGSNQLQLENRRLPGLHR